MISILTWISIATGGLLILMMLLSLLGSLDLDIDIGSAEIEGDSGGGIGLIKGFLTFISVSSWVVKILLSLGRHPGMALIVGIISGVLAFALLNYLFRLLLRNEENVNWSLNDALFQKGEVYLKIPADQGSGLVNVDINGATRELRAKSAENKVIKTGEHIVVVGVEGDYVFVKQDLN